MIQSILKFGLITGGFMVGLFMLFEVGIGIDNMSFTVAEVVGYITMILSLLGIFLGIKVYRDEKLAGNISFGKAFLFGTGVNLVAAFSFGVYSFMFFEFIVPDFTEKYNQYMIDQIKKSGQSQEVINQQIVQMREYMDHPFYSSSEFQGFVMFATVFLLGLVVTLISAAILKRSTATVQGGVLDAVD